MARRRSAIIPYRFVDGGLKILLITKSSGKGWGIPKGKIEADLKPHISAAKEAFEEAGVLGFIHPINVGTYPGKKGLPVPTFLLKVEIELRKKVWPEKQKRSRLWVNADDCTEYLTDENLLTVVNSGIQCVRSDGRYFKQAVKTFCDENRLNLLEADEDYARLEYRVSGKDVKNIRLTRLGSTIKFQIHSPVVKRALTNHAFSINLLRLNARNRTGFWCIEQDGRDSSYCLTNNAQLKLLDSRHFAEIIAGLIAECGALERTWAESKLKA